MNDVVLRHSYSALKQYENCPRRYYLQRITKTVKDVGGEASLHGERVHKAFEDRLRDKTPLPDSLKEHEPTVARLEALAGKRNLVLCAEQELTINVSYALTGWWDEDAWLRAKLDVLMVGDDTAAIVDWKTGKRRPDFTQMDIFALMVFLAYPHVQKVATTFYWLPERATDKRSYHRDDDEGALIVALTSRVSRIERSLETETWPAKPSGLCRYCPAQNICDAARIGA